MKATVVAIESASLSNRKERRIGIKIEDESSLSTHWFWENQLNIPDLRLDDVLELTFYSTVRVKNATPHN